MVKTVQEEADRMIQGEKVRAVAMVACRLDAVREQARPSPHLALVIDASPAVPGRQGPPRTCPASVWPEFAAPRR